ncbi:PepSY-like domain-containing protein [Flavitalea sp.]|nr:PepSY-like domain-containing protein [Flavitalea sp.]
MKKYLLSLLFVGAIFGLSAQEKSTGAPAAAKQAFAKAFPGASKVKWEKEGKEYEVNFIQGGKEMSAVYDEKGTLSETEEEIKPSALPDSIVTYIKEHYKGAAIKDAAKITKPNGDVMYEAVVNKTDLMFDANGKFIKEEKD